MQSPESKQECWKNELENLPAEQICTRYTEVLELFKQFEIPVIYPDVTVKELIAAFPDHVFRDRGTTRQELYEKVKTCMATPEIQRTRHRKKSRRSPLSAVMTKTDRRNKKRSVFTGVRSSVWSERPDPENPGFWRILNILPMGIPSQGAGSG